MMNNSLKTYQQMHLSGLNQKELIVLLYNGAEKFIEEGRELILESDVPGTFEKLNRARNIFLHLLSTLNMEVDEEFTSKLSALYAYFVEKITMANAKKDIKELDDIIPLITDLRESWGKIDLNDENIPDSKKIINNRPVQVISTEV